MKRVVYLIDFLCHKTLKSVSLLYVAISFTSAPSTTKCTLFPNIWLHFSSNKIVSQTVTRTKWDKWHKCKNSLNFLFGTPKCKIFSCDSTKVVKMRVIFHNKRYTCFFPKTFFRNSLTFNGPIPDKVKKINIISLSCHEQVCLSGLRFERYFSHHRAT